MDDYDKPIKGFTDRNGNPITPRDVDRLFKEQKEKQIAKLKEQPND